MVSNFVRRFGKPEKRGWEWPAIIGHSIFFVCGLVVTGILYTTHELLWPTLSLALIYGTELAIRTTPDEFMI